MATITTAIRVQDAMTPAFHSMNNALNIVLSSFETLQNTSSKAVDIASIQTARQELANANATIIKVEEQIKRANNESGKMPSDFEKANQSANSLLKTLMGFSIIQKVGGMIKGQIDSAISRMDTLNNYPKVMSNLGIDEKQANISKDMLSEGLKGLPTTLNDAVSSVQNFTSVNGNVGKSTKMFLALNNAILAGGGSTQVQQSALEQLSQAYAKGKPDMMEWRSAMTAMPAQLSQVAKAMGYVNTNNLREDLVSGKVSMDSFINTFIRLNEAGENGFQSFEEQARNATGGFATSIANMKSAITRGITNVISGINNGLESAGLPNIQTIISNVGSRIEKMLTKAGNVGGKVIKLLSPVYQLVQNIGIFISNNWSVIAPIIMGIVGAFVALKIEALIYNAVMGTSAFITGMVATAKAIHASTSIAEAAAVKTATGAQVGLNVALLACPITWIIIGIIALIAVFVILWEKCEGVRKAVGNMSASGAKAIGWLYNSIIVPVANGVIDVLNFLNNAEREFWKATINGFADMAINVVENFSWILKGAQGLIDAYNTVASTLGGKTIDINAITTDTVNTLRNKALQGVNDKYDEKQKEHLKLLDLDKWNAAADKVGENISNFKFSDMFNKIKDEVDNSIDESALDNVVDTVGNIDTNTGAIKNSLDSSEEDLKYLRDIAERETINRFTTAEIKVEMNNSNTISSNMDIDGIADQLGEVLEERMYVLAEGVHN